MNANKIGGSKPKRSSLISNLLNRVDEKSLAIKKQPKSRVLIYWTTEKAKHIKCTRQILALLTLDEIYELFDFNEVIKQLDFDSFNLEIYVPQTKVLTDKSLIVRSFKEVDKIGTDKGETEIFKKKK